MNGIGSLQNLAAVLNASNLPADSKKDVNRVEDFLQTVTEAYILTAFLELLEMDSFDAIPAIGDSSDLSGWVLGVLDRFLDTYVDFKFEESQSLPTPLIVKSHRHSPPSPPGFLDADPTKTPTDPVVHHARQTLSFGLFLMVVKKWTRKADGDLTVPIWKSLTGYFHAGGQTKYR